METVMEPRFPTHELPGDIDRVIATLRAELESRGHAVGRDTAGFKRDLYIGDTERPGVLFEFKQNAEHAAESMYHGRWEQWMPHRIAVIPCPVGDAPSAELLEQAGIHVLCYDTRGRSVVFQGLDEQLARYAPR
jgi:hypothetical protein